MSDELDRIRATYLAYFEAFQTKDPRAVLPYYHVPCVVFSVKGVSALLSSDDVVAEFGAMLRGLSARGYERSEVHSMHVKQLSPEMALLSVHGARYKSSGERLEGLGAVYTMRKVDGDWKIVVTTVHDPEVVVTLG